MRSGIILAISVSLVLVGGASWYRFSPSKSAPNMIAVEQNRAATDLEYEESFLDFVQNSTSTPVPAEPLTTTDLVGRQMIMDYLALAENNQATDANLSALAEKYIENIPTFISPSKLTFFDLKVVANSQANFQTYSSAVKAAYQIYATNLNKASGGDIGEEMINGAMAKEMGQIYTDTASKLEDMAVPGELAQAHLDLINTYLEDASAMESLAGDDPTNSFSGLITLKNNVEKERETLMEIENIINGNGI